MELPEPPSAAPPPGSRASKGCGASNLSLLLC
ncbi:MAG: SapB/AmfS family lanthipeptide [Actinomycetota bacterium]|nr:SapB/AmfS family lanthipeptide [Actinomycetota bacterium]